MSVGFGLVGFQAASAELIIIPDSKIVRVSDHDVLARCTLRVQNVDPTNNYATKIRLSAQAQPNNSDAYVDNVYTQVDCYIMPAGDTNSADALAQIHPYSNGATVLAQGTTVTLAFADSYTLCGRALVKLINGDTSYTPYNCA